jgi:hypothetical protein
LDGDNQDHILKHAGFDLQRLEIIRTSVDRPEISIAALPLVRGYVNYFRRLHCLLGEDMTPARVRERYGAGVRGVDNDIIFNKMREETDCRIILATVSLGMELDLAGIIRVVQFGLPKTASLAFGSALEQRCAISRRLPTRDMSMVWLPCSRHTGRSVRLGVRRSQLRSPSRSAVARASSLNKLWMP